MTNGGLATIVPAGVALAESWGTEPGLQTELLPEEAMALGRVVDKRRNEFALGRTCARAALGKLGVEPGPILRGPMREPLWPAGVVGSITHCDGYAAAAVARTAAIRGIGVDAEPRGRLSEGVLRMVATGSERRWLSRATGGVPWDVLLFSAKESVFKAWFPAAGSWLGFDEAEVEFDPGARTFRATLSPAGGHRDRTPRVVTGRYHATEVHMFTCACILY